MQGRLQGWSAGGRAARPGGGARTTKTARRTVVRRAVRTGAMSAVANGATDSSVLPTMLSLSLIWVPRKSSATMATIAMSARMSAYSARPWPSSCTTEPIDDGEDASDRGHVVHLLSSKLGSVLLLQPARCRDESNIGSRTTAVNSPIVACLGVRATAPSETTKPPGLVAPAAFSRSGGRVGLRPSRRPCSGSC